MNARRASDEFRAFFEGVLPSLLKTARKIIGDGDQHIPMLMVFHDNDSITATPMDMGQKDLVAALHRTLALNPRNRAVIFITETWLVTGEPDMKVKGSLEHVPGRKEAIMFSARHGYEQLMAMGIINRPKTGEAKGSTISDPKIVDPHDPDTLAAGRFVDGDIGKAH